MKLETKMYFGIDSIANLLNRSINLRKVKQIDIEENGKIFNPRPQQHIMIIAPFGSLKSTLLKHLQKVINNDVLMADNVTMPSLLGTISPKGEFIEGLISKAGGKIIGVDEWDNVNYFAQKALLSPLENQEINRNLGFAVNKPFKKHDDFTNITVNEGIISGKIQFTCIVMSMDHKMRRPAEFALASRFRMVRLDITEMDLKKIINGLLKYEFIDKNQIVENILVKNNTWLEYTDYVYDFLEKNGLYPPGNMLGYINRSIHDGLRDVIGNMIINDPKKEYIIDNSEPLIKNIDSITQQLQMYTAKIPTIDKLRELYKKFPNMESKFYYEKLNITNQHFYRLRDEIEGRIRPSDMVDE